MPTSRFFRIFMLLVCFMGFFHKINAQNKDKKSGDFHPKDWGIQHFSVMVNYQLLTGFINQKKQGENQFIYKGGTNNLCFNARVFTKRGLAFRLGLGIDSAKYTYQNGNLSTNYVARRKDFKTLIGCEIHFPIARPLWFYTGVFLPITIMGKDYLSDVTTSAQNVGDITIDNDGKVHFGLGVDLGLTVKIAKFIRMGVQVDGTFTQFSQAYWDLTVADDAANLKQMQGGVFATLGIAL